MRDRDPHLCFEMHDSGDKDLSLKEQFLGCFEGWQIHKPTVPALTWLRQYNVGKDLPSDLSASLTVFFTLIPQGLAYATLAGMPPVFGLYAAGVPVIIYSLLGSSRHLVLGPFAITSLLVAKVCESIPNIEVGGPMYVKIVLTVTLMTGVVSLVAGIFKLGVAVQYLSSSVLSGFLTGCAILIIISQLKDVLGISLPEKLYTHEIIIGLLTNLGQVKPYALAFSIPSFAALYATANWKRKNPNTPAKANNLPFQTMTWIANSSYFLVFLICTVISSQVQRGPNPMNIHVVGYVPPGIQNTMFDSTAIPSSIIASLIPQSFMIAFVGFSCNWAVVKRYSELLDYPVDPSQELVATGIANIFGSLCFNSFVNAGGMARTAVNVEAGGRTQLSCALAASFILVMLQYFTTLTFYIPMAVLGSIIIAAVLSLVDISRIKNTYLIDKKESSVMLVTLILTVFVGIAAGIVLGIVISMAAALLASAFPTVSQYGLVLDEASGRRIYRDMETFPSAQEVPGVAIIRMHANLYFANAAYLKEVALRCAKGAYHDESSERVRAIIFDMSASVDIDGLGLVHLQEMQAELKALNVEVFYVQFRGLMLEKIRSVDFFKKNGKATIRYKAIDEAVLGIMLEKQVSSVWSVKPPPVPATEGPADATIINFDIAAASDRDVIPNPVLASPRL